MRRLRVSSLRSLAQRARSRMDRRASRMLGSWAIRRRQPGSPRIARQVQALLRGAGYREQNYITCLLTEAQCLRAEETYGAPGPAWGAFTMPAVWMLGYQIRRNLLQPLRRLRQGRRGAKRQHESSEATSSAGLFMGMNYRFRSAGDPCRPEPERYQQITRQAERLLKTYQTLAPTTHGKGAIGILISCYRPEAFIDNFLENLCTLATPERLVPVVINAGMSGDCEATILHKLAQSGFLNHHFLNRPNSGIYEAWNEGIKQLGNSVEFITNFNVDDRRHPLCLNVQADCLNAFTGKQVAITDYCYFFVNQPSSEELYALNTPNVTLIPTVNQRTLIDRNFPHSSPLWRSSLHHHEQCGLFDTSYQSAGDAEFWYRVSRRHPQGFSVISIPLSLYYQNPRGLSTRPQTIGLSEHQRCTREHYDHLTTLVDQVATPAFLKNHLQLVGPEHLQLYACASALAHQDNHINEPNQGSEKA